LRTIVTFRLIIASVLQKSSILNHTNEVLRASSLFRSLHVSAASEPRIVIVIPNKKGKKFPKCDLQLTLEGAFQHSKLQTQVKHWQDAPKPERTAAHKTQWTQTSNTKITITQNQYGKPSFFEKHHASSWNPKNQRKTAFHL
jgi:hypothetical protein